MEVLYHGERIELETELEVGEQKLDVLSYPNEDTIEFTQEDVLRIQEGQKEVNKENVPNE